jgi:uncharacterized protein (DUF2235 family)
MAVSRRDASLRRIVVCCDGTLQDERKETNVHRLYECLDRSHQTVKYYFNGVGTNDSLFQSGWNAATGACG